MNARASASANAPLCEAIGPAKAGSAASLPHTEGVHSARACARPHTAPGGRLPSAAMTEQPDDAHERIEAALAELRTEATSSLERLNKHRDRAAELRAEADAEQRAYATEFRAIRARGFFTAAQLREMGFPVPRTKQRRAKR